MRGGLPSYSVMPLAVILSFHGPGKQGGDTVLLRQAHDRQSHSAVIATDHAMNIVIEYPALSYRLASFGNTFRITSEDFDLVINAGNIDAALRVNIRCRQLIGPIDNNARPPSRPVRTVARYRQL